MSIYSGHKYVVYNANTLPRKGADCQEAAWDDNMRAMVYNKLSDAASESARMKSIRGSDYSIYRQKARGKGECDPIASTALWAITDDSVEHIDIRDFL